MIKPSRKIIIISLFSAILLISLIVNMPAWLVGSLASHYSQDRIITSNETGSFWHGHAIFSAVDHDAKNIVPLIVVDWKLKVGFAKFIEIDFTSSNQPVANIALTKSGLQINNLNLILSLDQLTPFLGTLGSLRLSGNIHASAANLLIAKKMQGVATLKITDVGSGISPVNPIGNYNGIIDLANASLKVSSDPNSAIDVSGSGTLSGLALSAKVQPDQKDKLLQFMTMMGIPKADGSYQLKVF